MTDATLAELERLAGAAESGPWKLERQWSNGCEVCPRVVSANRWVADVVGAPYLDFKDTLPNGEYIAAAHPGTVLELVAEIRRLRAIVAKHEDFDRLDTR